MTRPIGVVSDVSEERTQQISGDKWVLIDVFQVNQLPLVPANEFALRERHHE
ncbi:hypothetical protein [Mycetocola tolaasinivorans]|uniref:hypothetical protein n=1 Tax=Mycetocola tolaasinivorans TaxID=76635 RepID=UPI001602FCE1|nr:hypothetical protein [Mycetocola tolaasinivorans]